MVWQVDCENRTGNPSDYKLEDQHVVGIGFVTKGEKLGVPLHAATAPQNDGGNCAGHRPGGLPPVGDQQPGCAGHHGDDGPGAELDGARRRAASSTP